MSFLSFFTTAKYLFNEHLSDITFEALNDETGEMETIVAHKFILAGNCAYFRNLFYESNGGNVVLNNKSVRIMKLLFEYIYTKKIAEELGFETTLQLCELAKEMKYDELLKYICHEHLSQSIIDGEITIKNMSLIYFLWKKLSLKSMGQCCNRFLKSNAKQIINDKLFSELDIYDEIKVLVEAVKVMDNDEVFNAIFNQIELIREDKSALLLKLVDLRKFDQQKFEKYIRDYKLIEEFYKNTYSKSFAAFRNEQTMHEHISTTSEMRSNCQGTECADSEYE
ncbi:BTB/POZ domain-containing protein 9-like protein [Leptotrombidium deliense]|uniref:BTB/POZ domain-containing protein 9-like protein n=1 Tax=Leptotrombidium deliense TaxID=299467 RepID=A0A443S6M7_9ACAR|nr:BTB/POZ domain-containing protein 9-like protein [Leptotrombidium deliense]